jgi:hypothetical protein
MKFGSRKLNSHSKSSRRINLNSIRQSQSRNDIKIIPATTKITTSSRPSGFAAGQMTSKPKVPSPGGSAWGGGGGPAWGGGGGGVTAAELEAIAVRGYYLIMIL